MVDGVCLRWWKIQLHGFSRAPGCDFMDLDFVVDGRWMHCAQMLDNQVTSQVVFVAFGAYIGARRCYLHGSNGNVACMLTG